MNDSLPMQARFVNTLNYWVRATLPALLVVGAGATVFRSAVIDSIQATPYPELIYLIFAAFFIALVLSWYVLHTYLREEAVLMNWRAQPPRTRDRFIASLPKPPELLPIYNLLDGKSRLPWRMRQAAVDSELRDCEKRLYGRLALPGYIGGALVGLGLVGTFIGLLGTLKELSTLFAALLVDQDVTGQSQAEMFQEMISRLQAPMGGMATAFVSSLYGLLGSLIVGLVIMTVRKNVARLVNTIRQSVRKYEYGAGAEIETALQADADLAWAESERWRAMFDELRDRNEAMVGLITGLRDEAHALLASAADLKTAIRERSNADEVIAAALADGSAALARANEHYESMIRCTEDTRIDIQSMVKATHVINETLVERNRIDAMVQTVFEQGPRWMTAWDDISTETRRVRYLLEQGGQQAQQRDDVANTTRKQILDSMLQLEVGLKSTLNDAQQRGEQAQQRDDVANTMRQLILDSILQVEVGLKSALNDAQQRGVQTSAEQREVVEALQACRQTIDELNAKLRLGLGLPPEPVGQTD